MAYQYDASSRPLQRSENAIYEIEQNWQFMTEEEFNPVPLALQLMDSSSVGRSYSEFMRYFHALDDSLKDIVEEYYQGFNNSILSFGEIKDKITETQQTLRLVQGRVKQTSEMLSQDKSSLAQLYYKCSQHNEMIRILDRIEELKQISTDIEDLNSRKQYLASVQKLLAGLETVNSDTMRSIGALSDLSAQLNKEKGTVFEVLIEELHNHVYLKSPYCERKLGIVDADDDVDQNDDLSRSARATHSTATGEHTSQSKKSPWHRREGRDDATGPDTDNPEADSYSYVEMLIKSLVLLERIDDTVTAIQERIPIELYNLANRVIAEVEERHKVALESTLETHEVSHASFPQSRMTVEQRSQAQDILEDFVTTLYARFGSVLEYHKFALEVIDRESRRGSDQRASALAARGLTSSYALREVWMAIQSEIKSLLYDYLTADVVVARESDLDLRSGTTAPSSVSSLLDSFKFRDKRGRLGAFDRNHGRQWLEDLHIIRGKGSGSNGTASHSPLLGRSGRAFVKDSKQIFSFSQSEIKDTTEALYKPVGDEMHQALGSLSHPSINHISPANPTAIDRFADSNSSAGHRLLVPPSIYHASVVLTPTTQFLAKVGHVLLDPRDTQEFDEFLRHFFVRFFLPQVEAHAMQLFQQLTSGSDAFYNHPTLRYRGRPVVKSVVALVPLIHDLSGMLSAIPFYQKEYVTIIEKIIRQYFDECQGRFNEAVTTSKLSSSVRAVGLGTLGVPTSGKLPGGEGSHSLGPHESPILKGGNSGSGTSQQQCIAYRWVQDGDLRQLLEMKLRLMVHEKDLRYDNKGDKETELEFRLKNERSIHPGELMFDVKKMNFLATLHHSLEWFLTSVHRSSSSTSVADIASELSHDPLQSGSGQLLELDKLNDVEGLRDRLDQLWDQHRALATSCLLTLRTEMRCRCIYYLELVTREGKFALEDEAQEPDQYVQTYNADLLMCEDLFAHSLPWDEIKFLFSGLSHLISYILVGNVTHLKDLNSLGVRKMVRNILALQQNLTNISLGNEPGLDISLKYYELFQLTLDGLVHHLTDLPYPFTYEQYRVMLDFVYNTTSRNIGIDSDDYEIYYRKYREAQVLLDRQFADAKNSH